jgi:hypothetical protein
MQPLSGAAVDPELRNRNLLPILFDFAIPARDVTENY